MECLECVRFLDRALANKQSFILFDETSSGPDYKSGFVCAESANADQSGRLYILIVPPRSLREAARSLSTGLATVALPPRGQQAEKKKRKEASEPTKKEKRGLRAHKRGPRAHQKKEKRGPRAQEKRPEPR